MSGPSCRRGIQRGAFGFAVIGGDLGVRLLPVGMVVRQRRVNLSQTQVTNAIGNLFGSQSEPVPADDSLHGHTGFRNPRTLAAHRVREVGSVAERVLVSGCWFDGRKMCGKK